jgi:uncharacterized protein
MRLRGRGRPARVYQKAVSMDLGSSDYISVQFAEKFHVFDPKPEDFRIEDIANALSMIPRFGGHTPFHYSVAQHCVLGASQVEQRFKLEFLMHDRAEAYIGDMVRPIKLALLGYAEIEERIMEVSASLFDVPVKMSPEVKLADNRMLVTEANTFFSRAKNRWWEEPHWPAPYNIRINQWSQTQAARAFLGLYKALR